MSSGHNSSVFSEEHHGSEDDVTDLSEMEEYAGENEVAQAERYALIRQVRTSVGAEKFVQSVVQQTILSSNCDWGALLSSAPRALCHMGQCFVVASSPLAASLELPARAGLQYV
jgi:hypothetical protein